MMTRYRFLVMLSLAIALPSQRVDPQVIALATRKINPRLTLGDTLTVTATPAVVNITLISKGVGVGNSAIAVTTSWTGTSLLASLGLYGYFVSATSALSGGTPVSSIPSSSVSGRVPTGLPTVYTAFTQMSPFASGSSLSLFTVSSVLNLAGNRTDNLSLQIDLSTLPQLPAGTYSGTLFLGAQAL